MSFEKKEYNGSSEENDRKFEEFFEGLKDTLFRLDDEGGDGRGIFKKDKEIILALVERENMGISRYLAPSEEEKENICSALETLDAFLEYRHSFSEEEIEEEKNRIVANLKIIAESLEFWVSGYALLYEEKKEEVGKFLDCWGVEIGYIFFVFAELEGKEKKEKNENTCDFDNNSCQLTM